MMDNEALQYSYDQACKLVAQMHEAAMGERTGPVLGVIEDIAALRAEMLELRRLKDETALEVIIMLTHARNHLSLPLSNEDDDIAEELTASRYALAAKISTYLYYAIKGI